MHLTLFSHEIFVKQMLNGSSFFLASWTHAEPGKNGLTLWALKS